MNGRHSYLDSLNAGRERRAARNSMEQLTRSLETLEQRIGRDAERHPDDRDSSRRDPLPQIETGRWDAAPRRAEAAFDLRGDRSLPRADDYSYRTLARDFERLRTQEDGVAAVGKIAGELKGLRDELRQQMTTGLKREFDALRADIGRAYGAREANKGPDLGSEFERLSNTIQSLSQQTDDRGLKLLRVELEQVRGALDTLAREETVRSVDRRWDELDRRFAKFEDRFADGQRTAAEDPAIAALSQRLEQISRAVNDLPESLSLRSLEEKVRTLAGAIDHLARQQDSHNAAPFDLIEERLDEISRAIVASAAAVGAPQFDTEPFERIEARITSLARQIEELVEDRPSVEVVDRLNMLSQRVDEIATRAKVPDQTIERLANQIGAIAEKLDRPHPGIDPEDVLRGIEERFDALSRLLDRRQDDAIEHGQAMFRDLEQRLELLAARLDQARAAPAAENILEGIDQRFDMLSEQLDRKHADAVEHEHSVLRDLEQRLQMVAERLDERHAEPGLDGNQIMNVMDSRFEQLARRLESRASAGASDEAIHQLEARLEDISARLEHTGAQVGAVDPEIIRSLEAQVAELSRQLSRPAAPMREFEDIGPRLDDIERSLTDTRETILEAARQAAENAVRSFAASGADAALVDGFTADLKSLEELGRRSDERNTKTFEAIHDTLLKIVERLASIEDSRVVADEKSSAPARPVALRDAPSIEPVGAMPLTPEAPAKPVTIEAEPREPSGSSARPSAPETAISGAIAANALEIPSPAAAASAAAADAIGESGADKPDAEQPSRVRAMLGSLTKAFARKQPEPTKTEPTLPGMTAEEPPLELDQPLDPKLVNRPLEPGSGAPDLNAIMRRVRDERSNQPRSGTTTASSSEFVMAARRRAQEAAAEAQVQKRGPDKASGDPKGGGLLHNRRKLLLMGATAVIVTLAGFQLSKAFFSGDPQLAGERSAASTAVGPAEAATADATSALPGEQDSAPAPEVANEAAQMSPVLSPPEESTETAAATSPETARNAPAPVPSQPPAATAPDSTSEAEDVPATPQDDQVASVPRAAMAAEPGSPASAEASADALPTTADPAAAPAKGEPVPVDAGPVPLREAAEAGDPKAIFTIGSRYAEGRGTKSDMKAAAKWYEKSAELGFAPAQYRIGNFYEKGIGVDRSAAKAKTWYQMAAEQGNAAAMHNLAVLFAMGVEGPADNDSAARWFQRAAELGVKDSQFNLGILSARGLGVPQNLEESYKWFALVAKTGDRDAAAKRDEIANAMRPEQLQQARAAVELWKPKPVDPEANSAPQVPDAWTESDGKTASVDMQKAIRNIQIILNKNGYDAGSTDGMMGDKTKQAIMAFQKANGMNATGEIDQTLVKKLLEKK